MIRKMWLQLACVLLGVVLCGLRSASAAGVPPDLLYVDLRALGHGLGVTQLDRLPGSGAETRYEYSADLPDDGFGSAVARVALDGSGSLSVLYLSSQADLSFVTFAGSFDQATWRAEFSVVSESSGDWYGWTGSLRVGPDPTWVTGGGGAGSVSPVADAIASVSGFVASMAIPGLSAVVVVGAIVWLFRRVLARSGGLAGGRA